MPPRKKVNPPAEQGPISPPSPTPPSSDWNEWSLHTGENLPNHTKSLIGHGRFVTVGVPGRVLFRTREEVYRFCAWALHYADTFLPHDTDLEEQDHLTFEEFRATTE